jgi:hypothetical protein
MAMNRAATTMGLALAAALVAAPTRAIADDSTLRLALGAGSAGRYTSGSWSQAFPIELTLIAEPFVLVSAGGVLADGGLVHGYFELGFWLGASFGAGLGYGGYESPNGWKEGGTAHLFLGLPIPLQDLQDLISKRWFFYLEPYYRPSWGPWSGTAHETGLMLKVSYAIVKGTWQFK